MHIQPGRFQYKSDRHSVSNDCCLDTRFARGKWIQCLYGIWLAPVREMRPRSTPQVIISNNQFAIGRSLHDLSGNRLVTRSSSVTGKAIGSGHRWVVVATERDHSSSLEKQRALECHLYCWYRLCYSILYFVFLEDQGTEYTSESCHLNDNDNQSCASGPWPVSGIIQAMVKAPWLRTEVLQFDRRRCSNIAGSKPHIPSAFAKPATLVVQPCFLVRTLSGSTL